MALIKKCNICSEKGMFLKLSNGICPSCYASMLQLENKYTKILQKIAVADDKEEILKELNAFIKIFQKFDGISNSISLKSCNSLLSNLIAKTTKENNLDEVSTDKQLLISDNTINLNESEIKKSPNIISSDNFVNSNSKVDKKASNNTINLKLETNNFNSMHNKVQSPIESSNTISDFKIRNIIEPVSFNNSPEIEVLEKPVFELTSTDKINNNSKSLNFKLTKNNFTPSSKLNVNNNLNENNIHKASSLKQHSSKSINLNLSSRNISLSSNTINNITPVNTDIKLKSNTINHSLKIQNMKSKCSSLISKINNPNESIDTVAKIYFNILDEILPILTENKISDIDGEDINILLENCKNTLCLRCRKKEDELFDFFNYVSIFVQTTGLTPNNSDIIEISALKISYGKIVDEFYTLVNPIKTIKQAVETSTGISNSDVENSKTIDLILPELLNFIGDFSLVTFNNKIVDLFLNTNLTKLNMPKISKPIISTINLYRIRFKNYYGIPTTNSDISSCAKDLLSLSDIEYINKFPTFSLSNSHAIYMLYEILKYRYK